MPARRSPRYSVSLDSSHFKYSNTERNQSHDRTRCYVEICRLCRRKNQRRKHGLGAEHLLALPAIIPEIRKMEIGKDIGHTEMSYDMVLIMHFDSMDALHTYKVHPDHQAVSSYVKKIRIARATVDREI